ncbi:hypothetical protein Y032_0055g2564 [Ancylostoma ceylanicum]|uniref:Uncharacterized protein n=1 Tax=Ancylostoma ceylanicum TaxID=53326 RepID=A0A016U6A0_9BILA|nr:hypothetical protein Y032_0055g2564 [Ancylostoma ceylanicum]
MQFEFQAKFITSELACLGIPISTYVTQPSGELVSYVNDKDLPLHLVDSIHAIARKMDVSCCKLLHSVHFGCKCC